MLVLGIVSRVVAAFAVTGVGMMAVDEMPVVVAASA